MVKGVLRFQGAGMMYLTIGMSAAATPFLSVDERMEGAKASTALYNTSSCCTLSCSAAFCSSAAFLLTLKLIVKGLLRLHAHV